MTVMIARGLILASCLVSSGCGSALWLLTPRPEATYQEIARTSEVEVTTSPAGATLYVDGAEAGMTPRRVRVVHGELRRQRRQSTVLPVIGTLVDLIAFSAVMAAALDEGVPEAVLAVGSIGAGTLLLDLYLITGRSVVNEGVETLPAAIEVGARVPGFHDVARKVRIPDLDRVHFTLVPATQAPPPGDQAPLPLAPPSLVPQTEPWR